MSSYEQHAVEILKRIETGDRTPLSYINPNKYIQHNLALADGLAGVTASGNPAQPDYQLRSTRYASFRTAILCLLTQNTTSRSRE